MDDLETRTYGRRCRAKRLIRRNRAVARETAARATDRMTVIRKSQLSGAELSQGTPPRVPGGDAVFLVMAAPRCVARHACPFSCHVLRH